MKYHTDALPALITVVTTIVLIMHGPIPQLEHYHDFADQSTRMGIPRAFDVLSNLGFLVVGFFGVKLLWQQREHPAIKAGWDGYMLFAISLMLTAFGSGYSHLAPDNSRLLWDRLPIALACAGLLSAVRTETKTAIDGQKLTLILALAAVSSVMWWTITDQRGIGDLRPYLMIQCLPLILIPLWQSGNNAPTRDRNWFVIALLIYVVAKLAEIGDQPLYEITGWLSGHTLKHLLAAVAAGVLMGRLYFRTDHVFGNTNRKLTEGLA